MSKDNKVTLPYIPPKEGKPFELPDDVQVSDDDRNISLAKIRMACLQLAHSVGKSVEESLNDAQTFTDWVSEGKRKES